MTVATRILHRCAEGEYFFCDEYNTLTWIVGGTLDLLDGSAPLRMEATWLLSDEDWEGFAIPIRFCPFCGVDLATLAPKE